MDSLRFLFLIPTVLCSSEYSVEAESDCGNIPKPPQGFLEGEAIHYVIDKDLPISTDEGYTWYKNSSEPKFFSTDEKDRIHHHGNELFILNISTKDSGVYIARCKIQGKCWKNYIPIEIFPASQRMNENLLYRTIEESDDNIMVSCPTSVCTTCEMLQGSLTWYKDFSVIQGENETLLWVQKANKDVEGIYTCVCTWEHGRQWYNSSGSRRLKVSELVAHRDPEILSPTNKEQLAVEGVGIKLNCSVFCGTNVQRDCKAFWKVNKIPFKKMDGYNQIIKQENNTSNTIITAILTIERVSAKDFKTHFECVGVGSFKSNSMTLTLKTRGTITQLVIGCLCVLLFCVFGAVMVKCFAIDLALLFRPYLPLSRHDKDDKVYDAYVVYQTQSADEVTEDKLCHFVTNVLPSVLEEKHGYRLFIHGRDDIPGEDRLELVEDQMRQSRRLMVILTSDSESGSDVTDPLATPLDKQVVGGFDWQVGLHHALVQREMSVILIQLGDTGPEGYTHLPAGLQHLILKSAPIRWSEGAATRNSRFWKRVRYLMPARPASQSPQPAPV